MNGLDYSELDRQEVAELCERVGYGFVMTEASKLWKAKDETGSMTVGPCTTFTEPCTCVHGLTQQPCLSKHDRVSHGLPVGVGAQDLVRVRGACDRCYGCGWQFKLAKKKKAKAGR